MKKGRISIRSESAESENGLFSAVFGPWGGLAALTSGSCLVGPPNGTCLPETKTAPKPILWEHFSVCFRKPI